MMILFYMIILILVSVLMLLMGYAIGLKSNNEIGKTLLTKSEIKNIVTEHIKNKYEVVIQEKYVDNVDEELGR